jgi:hypothetical protein
MGDHEEALEVYRFGVSNSLKCGDHGLGAGDEDRQHVLDALSPEESVVLRAVTVAMKSRTERSEALTVVSFFAVG